MQISSLKTINIENALDSGQESIEHVCDAATPVKVLCQLPLLCQNNTLLQNIILLAGISDSPLHISCIEILCNFTQFPSNNAWLASIPKATKTLILCSK